MSMARSLKISQQFIETVKLALWRNGYVRQKDLADGLQLSLAVNN
jgi:hypothetical protein